MQRLRASEARFRCSLIRPLATFSLGEKDEATQTLRP
jgi:hypothetical protein